MPENQGPSHAHIPTCLLHDRISNPMSTVLSKPLSACLQLKQRPPQTSTNRGLGTWRIAKGCCPIDSVSTCSSPTLLRSDHRSPVKNLCNQLLYCGHFILLYKINRYQTYHCLGYFYLNGNINTKYFKRQVTIQELDSLSVIQDIPWLYDPYDQQSVE